MEQVRARISVGTETHVAALAHSGPARRANAEETCALWAGLFDGEWSIVGAGDADGKRMLLARRAPLHVAARRRLTERERAVVRLAVTGGSLKCIAYELRISSATVSARLRSALRKLGLDSRTDLIRTLGAGVEEPS